MGLGRFRGWIEGPGNGPPFWVIEEETLSGDEGGDELEVLAWIIRDSVKRARYQGSSCSVKGIQQRLTLKGLRATEIEQLRYPFQVVDSSRPVGM